MELKGHEIITRQALEEAAQDLPPNLRGIKRLIEEDLAHFSIFRDVLDVFPTFGHWTDVGQRRHFLRAASESEQDAYKNGVKWIHEQAFDAARRLRNLLRKNTRNFPVSFIGGPLGYAFHALQDSFTPSHTNREKIEDVYCITRIYVYGETTEPRGAWPGHAEFDEAWADPVWMNTVGNELIAACRELARIVVYAAMAAPEQEFQSRWSSTWKLYVGLFLSTRFYKTVRAPASAAPHLR